LIQINRIWTGFKTSKIRGNRSSYQCKMWITKTRI